MRLRPPARRLLWSLAALAGLAVGACFNPPDAAVMFSCDPAGSSACPAGYTCRDDGCCHREGADDPADDGACKLGGGAATSGPTATTDAATTGTTTSDTSTSGTTGTSTGTTEGTTDSSTSSTSTGPQTGTT